MKGPQRLPLDAAAVARFARRPALARHFLYFSNEVEAARARAASGAAHASLVPSRQAGRWLLLIEDIIDAFELVRFESRTIALARLARAHEGAYDGFDLETIDPDDQADGSNL